MKNPIPSSSLFTTPDSAEQLQHMADSMSNSAEAWRMMVFTFNYCHQLVEDELDRDEARQEELIAMRLAVAPRNDIYDEFGVNTTNSFNTPPQDN